FVSNKYQSLEELPLGAVIGTSSLRRQSQLLQIRWDLEIRNLRGNLDTRLRKLDEGQYQAILLACAGLIRLGLAHRIVERIPVEQICPAIGQGAIGIEARAEDAFTLEKLQCLNHQETRLATEAERAFLKRLGGGCQVPIAAYARTANCVIYDHLVNVDLLRHARADAELVNVGKRGGQSHISQEEINDLIVKRANSGKIVARLKGGDPFIFGRGGEEAEALALAGIGFEIVPGITSGYAAPAYAGIPVTHRDFSPSVAFITGHEDPDKAESLIAWDKISTSIGTLVFFMGVKNLPEIVENLLRHGRSPETPIALIQWGTYFKQEVLTGTLASIV